jgi:hypothetical protein
MTELPRCFRSSSRGLGLDPKARRLAMVQGVNVTVLPRCFRSSSRGLGLDPRVRGLAMVQGVNVTVGLWRNS